MRSLARHAVAEALGTAFLLAAIIGSGIMAQKLAGGSGALALLCNTLATGAILVVLILVFAPVSGAHFNPVVSLAFALRRQLSWNVAGLYVAAQLAGALLGMLVAHLMFELPAWQISTTVRTGAGQWLAEGIATFGLVLTVSAARPVRLAPLRPRLGSILRPPTGLRPRRHSPIQR
jgi:glycerol uptake facilitator-like aquaporin